MLEEVLRKLGEVRVESRKKDGTNNSHNLVDHSCDFREEVLDPRYCSQTED